jgi:hypothetical protein
MNKLELARKAVADAQKLMDEATKEVASTPSGTGDGDTKETSTPSGTRDDESEASELILMKAQEVWLEGEGGSFRWCVHSVISRCISRYLSTKSRH